ncbi:MAG: mismatch repair protein MutS2 [Candidatus Sumerlaeota bacterium]|nr:mismatch repair protein MutS2 [Candidatus Sumerlaeota bacterium]
MDSKTRTALEFDRLLEHLAEGAQSSLGQMYVRGIEPSADPRVVETRLARSAEALHLLDTSRSLPLSGLEDIGPSLARARAEGTVLDPEEWPRLRRFLRVTHDLLSFAERNKSDLRVLGDLIAQLVPLPELAHEIDTIFDKDGLVRDDASRDLARLRAERRRQEGTVQRSVQRTLDSLRGRNILQDELTTIRNGRHVFPVRASARSRVPGILHATSATGETVYIEPNELVELANAIELVRQQELQEIHRLMRELTALLRPWLPVMTANVTVLAEVDGVQALARNAARRAWKVPVVGGGGALKLYAAHHPLLHILHEDESVPIDVALDASDRLILLSGPNAGGKTTAMKTIALCALLVQCGSPVPTSPDARLPVFDAVLADIGDQQDLGEGLSTFTGHVRRLKEILAQAGPRTLVLFDELGTGTDPEEGGALAQATLEELLERAGLTIATSHMGPLKKWAEDTPGVRNASFSLNSETQQPTFRLRLDLPGASEALVIARNEGLPRRLLDRARSLVGDQKVAMGELLQRIEERERRLGDQLREAQARAESLEQQERIVRQRAEQLREERRTHKAEALSEREKAVREVRERIERLIANLPGETELRQRKDALNTARLTTMRELQNMAQERELLKSGTESPGHGGTFAEGQRVYVRAFANWGTIVRMDSDGRKARVVIGNVEADVPVETLARKEPPRLKLPEDDKPSAPQVKGARKKKKRSRRLKGSIEEVASPVVVRALPRRAAPSRPGAGTPPSTLGNALRFSRESISFELDLHGYRVDEALPEIDRYLDRALLAGYPHVRIIHGTGAGKLYRAVHEFLRTLPHVKAFRFATPDEGGGGCTVVDL